MENDPSLPLHLDENGKIIWPTEVNVRNFIVNVDLEKPFEKSSFGGPKISRDKFNKIISAAALDLIPKKQDGHLFYVNEKDYDKWVGGLG